MLKNIPTNIITGALGVGKTTLIQALLKEKPKDERWAILVNEFGEVGIDGGMLAGIDDAAGSERIFIKEVPGGCMCCTSGLPMQIALNLLLAQAKPHRLLIEPTGLGHPIEVLQSLTQAHYQDVLAVQATLTLIDARKLDDKKWRNHPIFRDQLSIADIVVATKSDLYTRDYEQDLRAYLQESNITSTPVEYADHGKVSAQLLAQPSRFQLPAHSAHAHDAADHQSAVLTAPEQGSIKVVNQGEGYFSRGWLCSPRQYFDYQDCRQLLQSLNVERLKAVIITNQGVFGFNVVDGVFEEKRLASAEDTRIELLSDSEEKADAFAQLIEESLSLHPSA